MELRVLQYFLAVTREQSISGAAEFLHLSQPTLSRQLRELEEELGKQLFVRGNRKITLTEDGMLLRRRAEEITDLVKKTEEEISLSDEIIGGDIHIGTGETDAVRLIIHAAKKLRRNYPQIHYHIVSGDGCDIMERLDKGLIDFGLVFGPVDMTKYEYLAFPVEDIWGVLMQRNSPLSKKESIRADELWDKPLILSRQIACSGIMENWLQHPLSTLDIVARYNLVYNASLMVDEGLGYALCLDKLINMTGESKLCFRPLEPTLKMNLNMVWKKYQIFSKPAEKFLDAMRRELN